MKSICYCPPAIQGALQEASPTNSWKLNTELQRYLFETYGSIPEPGLEEYLKTTTETNTARFRKWFADNGFPMEEVTIPPDGKAVGSIFDLLVSWKTPGRESAVLTTSGAIYRGVGMSKDFTLYEVRDSKNLLVHIPVTNENWDVYLFQQDPGSTDILPIKLAEHAQSILERKGSPTSYTNNVLFPEVKLEQTVDISPFTGLKSDEFCIDEAIKKIKLKVDKDGAHAQAAVGMTFATAIRPIQPPYVIDDTFLVIFKHKEHKFPAFVAQVTPEDGWIEKKPLI